MVFKEQSTAVQMIALVIQNNMSQIRVCFVHIFLNGIVGRASLLMLALLPTLTHMAHMRNALNHRGYSVTSLRCRFQLFLQSSKIQAHIKPVVLNESLNVIANVLLMIFWFLRFVENGL